MGFWDRLFGETHVAGADGLRVMDVPSIMNLRDLGCYATPDGTTRTHRYLRCGSTRGLMARDRTRLADYGLSHVLDLRGWGESPAQTDPYARDKSVTWANISFYGENLSDPTLLAAKGNLDYLSGGYLAMLGNHEAVRQIVTFLADVPKGSCALFHCAAGMDRTGMAAMLVLGAVGVSRADIIRDYLYSFGRVAEVDRAVDEGVLPQPATGGRLEGRLSTITGVYDTLIAAYGSVREFLLACGVEQATLVRLHDCFVG